MARHSGKNGLVKHGANSVSGLVSWDLEEVTGDVGLTAAGDTWESHDPTYKGWSGSITLRKDDDVASNQSLRAGDVVSLSLYTEGDSTGKKFFSGSATIVSHGVGSPHDSDVNRSYRFKGNGALTESTVP